MRVSLVPTRASRMDSGVGASSVSVTISTNITRETANARQSAVDMKSPTGLLTVSNRNNAQNVDNGNRRASFTSGANPKTDYSGDVKCA